METLTLIGVLLGPPLPFFFLVAMLPRKFAWWTVIILAVLTIAWIIFGASTYARPEIFTSLYALALLAFSWINIVTGACVRKWKAKYGRAGFQSDFWFMAVLALLVPPFFVSFVVGG